MKSDVYSVHHFLSIDIILSGNVNSIVEIVSDSFSLKYYVVCCIRCAKYCKDLSPVHPSSFFERDNDQQ